MSAVWALVTVLCIVDGSQRNCQAMIADPNTFLSDTACKVYARSKNNTAPDCVQAYVAKEEKAK